MHAILEAALAYAVRGWSVLPLHGIFDGQCTCREPDCDSPGKHPIVRDGLDEATTDVGRVKAWFDTWRWANLGVACGPSGIAALDVDPRNGGLTSLARFNLDLRQSGKVRTGDGFHLLFRGPAPTSVAHLGPGLDVRGVGGYIVAPPSLHVSGNVYTWLRLGTDPLPTWPFPAPEACPPTTAAEPLEPGRRNDVLFRIAGSLRRIELPAPVIRTVLQTVNAEHCKPPLSAREVDGIASKIMRRPPRGATLALPQSLDGRAGALVGPAAARGPWETATFQDAPSTPS
jgi:hypothetical protein